MIVVEGHASINLRRAFVYFDGFSLARFHSSTNRPRLISVTHRSLALPRHTTTNSAVRSPHYFEVISEARSRQPQSWRPS